MKSVNLILAIFLIILPSLSAKEEKNISWLTIDKPLSEFAKNHKGKDILVFYTAKWCLSSELMKQYLQSEEFTQLLTRENLIVVHLDCSENNSVGSRELKRGGDHTKTLPILSMLHQDGMVTYANLNLSSKDVLKKTITSILKKAEQASLLLPLIQAEEKVPEQKQKIITLPIAKSVPQLDSLRSNVSKALGESIYSDPSSDLYYTGEYFLTVVYRMPKVTYIVYMRPVSDPIKFSIAYKARDREGVALAKLKDNEIQKLLSRHAVDTTGTKLIWTSIGDNRWRRSDGNLAKYEVEKKGLIIATKKQAKKIIGF